MSVNFLQNHSLCSFTLDSPDTFKQKALSWSKQFEVVALMDNNQYPGYLHHSHEFLLAVGAAQEIVHTTGTQPPAFEKLKTLVDEQKGWLFGLLGYDLKNETEALSSAHIDGLRFPDLHFFRPLHVLEMKDGILTIHTKEDAPAIFAAISERSSPMTELPLASIQMQPRISKEEYLEIVQKIRNHILRGDIYEMNFCQEFFSEEVQIDPFSLFRHFNQLSQAPFSAFYRLRDRYLLCASPERFLKKEGSKLISQPIKGTIGRGETAEEDQLFREGLLRSKKDRSENVMIVDLVRNDLGRSCIPGTVQVEELCGIYGFNQVWQMISTVSGELRPGVHMVDALRFAFPMGSMTGAPKVRSMQLIEKYEQSRRGLYSGAVGYIRPNGDFDFNVVIRSLLYNASRRYLSFQVGGAIVFDSVAEKEYEECLLKAKAMFTAIRK